jgi:hypothetical protein
MTDTAPLPRVELVARAIEEWLTHAHVLGQIDQVIAPSLHVDGLKSRRKPRSKSSVKRLSAKKDFKKAYQLLLAGRPRLPDGVRECLIAAVAARRGITQRALEKDLAGRKIPT